MTTTVLNTKYKEFSPSVLSLYHSNSFAIVRTVSVLLTFDSYAPFTRTRIVGSNPDFAFRHGNLCELSWTTSHISLARHALSRDFGHEILIDLIDPRFASARSARRIGRRWPSATCGARGNTTSTRYATTVVRDEKERAAAFARRLSDRIGGGGRIRTVKTGKEKERRNTLRLTAACV